MFGCINCMTPELHYGVVLLFNIAMCFMYNKSHVLPQIKFAASQLNYFPYISSTKVLHELGFKKAVNVQFTSYMVDSTVEHLNQYGYFSGVVS